MAKKEVWDWDWEHGYQVNENLNCSSCSSSSLSNDQCSTRKIVKTQCKIEEVEDRKFIKKCEKTEQILKDCIGKPVELVKSTTEYTNEDVTNEKGKWFLPSMDSELKTAQSELGRFNFPDLLDDIETIEKNWFGGVRRFVEAAEDVMSGFDKAFGGREHNDGDSSSSSSSFRQKIPIESHLETEKETSGKQRNDNESVYSEFAGQIKDV